ncbi:MAG: TonB-dependent receptor, partial [Acidimicrobiia bacterium]|nr:TonB-dependent receptor [Acidimicrobiia bacterium]
MSWKHFRSRLAAVLVVALVLLVGIPPDAAARAGDAAEDLTELSLEQLLEVEITTVSKRPESAFRAAAAVFVLTAEDIRRSGARSLPDLLRLVPGVHVARTNSSTWAISARGFNGSAANKLQVLIDDRSVYTPLTSGVFWDVQGVSIEEIDRIEVVRGPGATLWGANAVNGVINVITKRAEEPGGYLSASVGTEERATLDAAWSGRLDSGARYRVSARHISRDAGELPAGGSARDDWDLSRGAFRLDGDRTKEVEWVLSGEIYDGSSDGVVNRTLPGPPFQVSTLESTSLSGGHLLGRWQHESDSGRDTSVRAYLERSDRQIPEFFGEVRTTLDLEIQQTVTLKDRHQLVYGLGYRVSSDDVSNSFTISWDPRNRDFEIFSAFIQDEIRSAEGKFALTLGSKFEHHEFTGLEVQPNVRFAWETTEATALWASVSRAVRTPSRLDHDARFNALVQPGEPPSILALVGNDGFDAEELIAVEAGFRIRPSAGVQVDLAAFHHS